MRTPHAVPTAAALAVLLGAASAAAAPARETIRYSRPGDARPALVAGHLTRAARGTPEEIAQRYLSVGPAPIRGLDPDSFALETTRTQNTGSVVVMRQTHAGLDVVGGRVAVRVDGRGQVRWVSSRVADVPATVPTSARLSRDQALTALKSLPGQGGAAPRVADTEKVVYAAGRHRQAPRLAYRVRLPFDPLRREALLTYVDATSGEILAVRDLVREAEGHLANVYQDNPVATPEVSEAALSSLPEGAETLSGPDFPVHSCVDRQRCLDLGEGKPSVHFCTFEQLAQTGGYGDFLDILPPDDESDFEDAFAEVQAYYHVSRALSVFRDIKGDPSYLSDLGLQVVVNAPDIFQLSACEDRADGPVVPDDAAFVPMENAFFTPGGLPDRLAGRSLVIGQAGEYDMAYDGDVLYHEFGHAVADAVALEGGIGGAVVDESGINPTPGGLSEGFADYFSAIVTGDPSMGEYAAKGAGIEDFESGLRSLENERKCPDNIWGESHEDGKPWAAALWAIRQSFPASERRSIDAAVLAALASVGPEDTFATVSRTIEAELETSIGYEAAETAREEFESRGLTGCDGRVLSLDGGAVKRAMLLRPLRDFNVAELGAAVPAPVQFSITVAEETEEIVLDANVAVATSGDSSKPVSATALLKKGEERITWTHEPEESAHDATHTAEAELVEPDAQGRPPGATFAFAGPFEPGVYHLQVVSTDDRGVIFAGLASPSAAEQPNGVKSDGATGDTEAMAGGGCRTGPTGAGTGAGALLLAVGLGLTLVRRRR